MMRRLQLRVLFSAALAGMIFVAPRTASGAVAIFGLNAYEYVEFASPYNGSNNSWFEAQGASAASTYNGINGHLVTITSQGENDFLQALAVTVTQRYGWIGGNTLSGWLVGPENGQPFSYTNWGGVEPNNSGYAYMLIGPNTMAGVLPGEWADDSAVQGFPDAADPVNGYFIEYELAAIPEPSTYAVILGLAGLMAAWFRSRRATRLAGA